MTKKPVPKKISRSSTRAQGAASASESQQTGGAETNKITRVALNDMMSLDFGPNPKKILSFKMRF
jgi:hypothetical protein